MNNFIRRKKQQFGKKDLSDEQKIDKHIEKLCRKINNTENYYTTSSCSGRVIIVNGVISKSKNAFLFKSHKKISFSELKKEIIKIAGKYGYLIYLKQEPCIIHIACFNLESAEKIMEKARDAGWKKKGIITARKRVIVELIGSEKLELPIVNKNKILVDDSYLKLIIKETNDKLKKSWDRINWLEKIL